MDISLDIIREVINIGIGEAANSLSELIDAPVSIKVPDLWLLNVADVPRQVEKEIYDIGVFISQDFHGFIEGKMLLAYSQACSVSLINVLFGDTKEVSSLSNAEIATLQEIGNIMMVSCLSTISNMIEGTLTFAMPLVTAGLSERYFTNLVKNLETFEQCILVKNEMTVKDYAIQGYVFILLSVKDLKIVVERLSASAAPH